MGIQKAKLYQAKQASLLTRVQRSESGGVLEITGVLSHAVLDEVIVEGKRRRPLDVGGVVAGAAGLDGPAVGTAGPAGPIER